MAWGKLLMAWNQNDEHALRQYLLGQSGEFQKIEQRLLVEDEFLEDLEAAEAHLVDEYVAGELTQAEREQFEQHFLTGPAREQDVKFARVMRRYVTAHPVEKKQPERQPWWQFWSGQSWVLRAAVAVLAVVAIAGLVWVYQTRNASFQTFATVNLTLSSGNRAGGAAPVPKIQLRPGTLKLNLQLPDNSTPTTNYRVKLFKGDGEVKTLEIVERNAQSISVVIPSAQLSRGRYAIELTTLGANGVEQLVNGNYQFAIE